MSEPPNSPVAREIVSRIESGEWTAARVVEAYIAQAIVAHEKTNCITEGMCIAVSMFLLFEQALKQAKELDASFASTKKLRGPLHGVPFSFSSTDNVIGFDTTVGFTQWANKPATSNAVLVQQLIDLGAIPVFKTNVPQTMFSFESSNPLWGRTTNPYNSGYTSGGSSGGEAAALALDGAAFGIGSDIGGSLRIPTGYCGIYSLKPSVGRISKTGALGPDSGFEGIKDVVGPMGRSVEDLDLFCRFIFGRGDNFADQLLVPLPYRETKLPQKLRFGYYSNDGFVKASPANRRAIMETVGALRKEGHECVEITVPNVPEAMQIFSALTSSDAYRKMTSHLGPDPMEPFLSLPVYSARVPGFLLSIATWVVETFVGDAIFANLARVVHKKSVGEYNEWNTKRNEYNDMFFEKVWKHYALDGIICPVQAMPQIPNGGAIDLLPLAIGTVLYNVVNSPCGVLPVTYVDAKKDQLTEDWTDPTKRNGSKILENMVYNGFMGKKSYYDAEAMEGMPVGIQLVGKRYEDEKVLGMMEVVDNALKKANGSNFGPGAARRAKGAAK
ncbi:amidase signature enzyme [Dendrothele bispora CBS 962.96]|uniref:amidase n=1 Tax=Dendrothele bispora (strain CBS 962.96) TaxID=1314807 RepID=A0A4S8M9P2_DENBC|nr:amidase signature enzyme [Dendrothele bispora CBS 962.96]